MKEAVAVVEKFMQACGQETPAVPSMTETAKLYFGNPDDLGLSQNGEVMIGGLVGEEIADLGEAWMRGDDVGVLDGGLDAIWTIIAGLRALGFPIVLGWEEVAGSNLAKIDPDTGAVIRRESDSKIMKPAGWKPPDLRAVLDKHGLQALASAAKAEFGNVAVRVEKAP